jgi:hypothetical protein
MSDVTRRRIKRYLVHLVHVTLLTGWTFGISENRSSCCDGGVECHRVKIEAMVTISRPASIRCYFISLRCRFNQVTSRRSLGLFGLEISPVRPSLFCSTCPCYRYPRSSKLLQSSVEREGWERFSDITLSLVLSHGRRSVVGWPGREYIARLCQTRG